VVSDSGQRNLVILLSEQIGWWSSGLANPARQEVDSRLCLLPEPCPRRQWIVRQCCPIRRQQFGSCWLRCDGKP